MTFSHLAFVAGLGFLSLTSFLAAEGVVARPEAAAGAVQNAVIPLQTPICSLPLSAVSTRLPDPAARGFVAPVSQEDDSGLYGVKSCG